MEFNTKNWWQRCKKSWKAHRLGWGNPEISNTWQQLPPWGQRHRGQRWEPGPPARSGPRAEELVHGGTPSTGEVLLEAEQEGKRSSGFSPPPALTPSPFLPYSDPLSWLRWLSPAGSQGAKRPEKCTSREQIWEQICKWCVYGFLRGNY